MYVALLVASLVVPSSVQATGLISAGRSFHLKVPLRHDPAAMVPLVILLHGFGADSTMQSLYFGLGDLAESKDFLFAYPDGTRILPGVAGLALDGKMFWNATDACCQIGPGTRVDDVAFIRGIIDAVMATTNQVDPNRIFVVGHSNGSFMTHRIACEEPRVAAIVTLSGAQWADPVKNCPVPGGGKVSVLHLHGTKDVIIPYWGGVLDWIFGLASHPSAPRTVEIWQQRNGCGGLTTPYGSLDLDSSVWGPETQQQKSGACPAGIDVELWTMVDSGHIPVLKPPQFANTIFTWLSNHPKVH